MNDEQQSKHLSDNRQVIKMMSKNCVVEGPTTTNLNDE
jgi:hypothetical protein